MKSRLLLFFLSLLFISSNNAQSTLYAIIGDKLVNINPNTAETTELTAISPGFENFSGMTYHADLDMIFMVADRAEDPRLISLDRCTGEMTEVGPIDLKNVDIKLIEAMEYNPNDGLLYAAGQDTPPPANFFSPRLMVVDPATGNATQVASITGTCQNESDGFAFTTGATYTFDGCPDPESLYTIDLATGTTSFIGSNGVQGTSQVTVDPATGTLYTVNPATQQLFSIDPSDASATVVGITHNPADFDGNVTNAMTFAPIVEISCSVDSCAQDSIPPMAVCQDITVETDSTGLATIVPADIDNDSFDDCGIDSMWLSLEAFSCGTEGVILFVRDSSENLDSCFAFVTVLDGTPPEIECPESIVASTEDGTCGSTIDYEMPATSDLCSSVEVTLIEGLEPGAFFPVGTSIQTFTAVDSSGNTATCSFTITVEGPGFEILCPNDTLISAGEAFDPFTTGFPTEVCGQGSLNFQDSIIAGNCPENFDILRLWLATDNDGNISSCTQVIEVRDTILPEITCPADTTVCGSLDPEDTGMATATTNSSATMIDYGDVILSGDCATGECVVERTWTVTDACGNSNACIQMITLSDNAQIGEAFEVDIDGDGIPDPIQLGILHHTITIDASAANCILEWLPGVDGPAWPLTRENVVVDSSNCTPGSNPVAEDGQIANPLMAAVLLLDIRLRLEPDFAAIPLDSIACDIHPILYQYMPNNPNVGDLYELSQIALGSLIGPPHLEHLLLALQCINGDYEICNPGNTSPPEPPIIIALEQENEGEFVLFPNPARDKIELVLPQYFEGTLLIELIDLNGRTIATKHWEDTADQVSFDLFKLNLAKGIYFVKIHYNEGLITKRFIKN
jgi:hypothetical protein